MNYPKHSGIEPSPKETGQNPGGGEDDGTDSSLLECGRKNGNPPKNLGIEPSPKETGQNVGGGENDGTDSSIEEGGGAKDDSSGKGLEEEMQSQFDTECEHGQLDETYPKDDSSHVSSQSSSKKAESNSDDDNTDNDDGSKNPVSSNSTTASTPTVKISNCQQQAHIQRKTTSATTRKRGPSLGNRMATRSSKRLKSMTRMANEKVVSTLERYSKDKMNALDYKKMFFFRHM